jgi:hypothetical protein
MRLWSDDKLRITLRVSQSASQSYILRRSRALVSCFSFPAPQHHVHWRALGFGLPATPSDSDTSSVDSSVDCI